MVRAKGPGGPVQGKVGAGYSNRTDLQRAEPIAVAPAAQYGERTAQQAAQRAIPLAAPPGPTTPTPVPPAPQGQPTPQGGGPAQPGLPPVSGPGVLPWLHPSNRPNEPVTAGLATGAGPGPEVLSGVGAMAANQSAEGGA